MKLDETLRMTADIVAAFVRHNTVPASQIPELVRIVHDALLEQEGRSATAGEVAPEPAVPVRRSVRADRIVCLEDGKSFKALKRHLRTEHGMTPEQYRSKWGLPADYPMVAPEYAARRSDLAKEIGLGRQSPKHRPGGGESSPRSRNAA
jgi:predicted transcriptional regulator